MRVKRTDRRFATWVVSQQDDAQFDHHPSGLTPIDIGGLPIVKQVLGRQQSSGWGKTAQSRRPKAKSFF